MTEKSFYYLNMLTIYQTKNRFLQPKIANKIYKFLFDKQFGTILFMRKRHLILIALLFFYPANKKWRCFRTRVYAGNIRVSSEDTKPNYLTLHVTSCLVERLPDSRLSTILFQTTLNSII